MGAFSFVQAFQPLLLRKTVVAVHDYDRDPAISWAPVMSEDLLWVRTWSLAARSHDDLDAVEVLGQGESG